MAVIRLEVEPLIPTLKNDSICRQAQQFLNIKLERMSEIQFYLISGAEHKKPELQELIGKTGHEVFCDPITSRYQLRSYDLGQHQDPQFVVEVSYKPGVTDNTGHSASEGLKLLEISAEVASGKLYFLHGNLNLGEAQTVAFELLGNELIENVFVYSYKEFFHVDRFSECIFPKVVLKAKLEPETITLNVTNAELEQISLDRCLALTLDEMNVIKNYFENEEVIKKRTTQNLPIWPTDVELEVLAQTWSEHCKHKIFAAKINYSEENIKGYKRLGQQNIGGLYKDLIKNSTKRIEKEQGKDWLISVFSDNAGIVRFDNSIDLCIKVETHNSPSALDPYGGALTGILGVNRDILGCGLGARPIANMDVFCFAPPALAEQIGRDNLPVGPKEPRRILEGVHLGVEDGGNKSGIPTVNGAFFFEENFAGKPLVFVGTVGALPQKLPDGRNTSSKNANSKDRIFMIGGAIGADGIHGATFSSLELNENSPATAVQIGDPLTQKRTSDFLLEARDLGLYSSVTDNGAGGLSSSVGEMATMTGGAEIDLSLCPMKYPGLTPYELMISESQERMTVAVPPLKGEEFLALAKARGVSASDIGEFNQGGYLSIYYGKNLVADLELDFLHDGLPSMNLCAKWDGPRIKESWLKDGLIENKGGKTTIKEGLNSLLSRPNIVSKESWVRRYDHEVQAATHIKPFGGETASGPNDSGVIWLYPHGGEKDAAAVIGCGLNPFLSQYDPYLMAQFSVDEAIRNIVATGGDIDNCCLLDNFCWPDP
ncbi:MAG: phosphoribosylformylglycinamidine synthase, partial [Halobacteriovoraceae bacterium]|nr:phosphoribosylformylglycinamidine synthase [Halobacteriovoraceae bacterium]